MQVTTDGAGNVVAWSERNTGDGIVFPFVARYGFPTGFTVTGTAPNRRLVAPGGRVVAIEQGVQTVVTPSDVTSTRLGEMVATAEYTSPATIAAGTAIAVPALTTTFDSSGTHAYVIEGQLNLLSAGATASGLVATLFINDAAWNDVASREIGDALGTVVSLRQFRTQPFKPAAGVVKVGLRFTRGGSATSASVQGGLQGGGAAMASHLAVRRVA